MPLALIAFVARQFASARLVRIRKLSSSPAPLTALILACPGAVTYGIRLLASRFAAEMNTL